MPISATCWYAVVTSRFPTGHFLQVSVTKDAGRFYLVGYSVTEFVGGKIPPELQ